MLSMHFKIIHIFFYATTFAAGGCLCRADGFSIPDETIDGNLYFANEENEASADLSDG